MIQLIGFLGLATTENDYFEEVTKCLYEELVIKDGKDEIILNLKEFNKKHLAIKSRLILYVIKKLLRF